MAVKLPIVFCVPTKIFSKITPLIKKECVFLSDINLFSHIIMDSFGDYIYLIILVVAGLSSLLKKKKNADVLKPAPIETEFEPEPETEPEADWEDVLRNLNPETKTELKKEVVVEKAAFNPIITYETVDDVSVMRAKKQVSRNTTSKRKIFNEDEPPTISAIDDIQFNSIDDARKAFIYSEIFNRKY